MTKKDYILIARAMRDARPINKNQPGYQPAVDALDNASRFLAYSFQSDNAKFNREIFLTACGVHA